MTQSLNSLNSLNGRTGRFVVLCSCALGLALLTSTVGQAALGSRANQLRFGVAVALPGVVLPVGTYTFEVANPGGTADVVRVWDSAHRRVHFTGFTYRVRRPENMPKNQAIALGEAGRGEPAPIRAWYPVGDTNGFQFIYR
jgi:hypothetical protein